MGELPTIGGRRKTWARLTIAGASLLLVLVTTVVVLSGFLNARPPRNSQVSPGMMQGSFHPIWKDLTSGQVRKGDDLAETIRRHPPVSREEVGPFIVLLYNGSLLGPSETFLRIISIDGVLIEAVASHGGEEHVFFDSPSQKEALRQAYSGYTSLQDSEAKAYQIHCAIAAGQDVFLCKQVERPGIVDGEGRTYSREQMRQYEKIYGAKAAEMLGLQPERLELTVEVSEVLSGRLRSGMVLTFSGQECDGDDLATPQTVFLHVEDSRTIRPDSEGGELYTTVPIEVLTWYRSLSPDEIQQLETRCRSRMTQTKADNQE